LSNAYIGTWINPEENYTILKLVYFPDEIWKQLKREASAWEEDIEILEGGWIKGLFCFRWPSIK
jgi:hypothetical protein